ncbi:MAG: hypothetical protein HOW73_38015 [Polyangiaceae bacterium]|nr:hypothetical protein [Polyangiaceae bacterium]
MMHRRAAVLSLLSVFVAGIARAADEPKVTKAAPRAQLPSGRSRIEVLVPPNVFATIALVGPAHALLGLEINGGPLASRLRRRRPLDEDGLLPRTLSVMSGEASEVIELIVDLTDAATIQLVTASLADDREPTFKGLKNGTEQPRPLVGMPVPIDDRAGYMLGSAGRYVFARIDVVRSLMTSFEKSRKKFNGDAICISDASQWDGKRPKADLGQVRHISHEGGCDVDIALPANDTFPSSVREHCRGVRLETDRFGCAPGTAKGVDFDRLAFFLGTLADESPGRIVKVFLDDAFRREVIRVAPTLHERGWIKEAGLVALGEDGVLVASPWHTDHFHVRFSGEKARTLLI